MSNQDQPQEQFPKELPLYNIGLLNENIRYLTEQLELSHEKHPFKFSESKKIGDTLDNLSKAIGSLDMYQKFVQHITKQAHLAHNHDKPVDKLDNKPVDKLDNKIN